MATTPDYWTQFYGGGMSPSVPFIPEPGAMSATARGPGMWGSSPPVSPMASPYMSADMLAQLRQQIAASKALQAEQGRLPMLPTVAAAAPNDTPGSALAMYPQAATNPAVEAATAAGNPVDNLTGTMLPRRSGGGILELLMGPSKNGLDGLPGLLGGPNAGGILGMLANPQPGTSAPVDAERKARGLAIGEANRRNPNPTFSKSGANNAFMPRSYQNSVRKQTGY